MFGTQWWYLIPWNGSKKLQTQCRWSTDDFSWRISEPNCLPPYLWKSAATCWGELQHCWIQKSKFTYDGVQVQSRSHVMFQRCLMMATLHCINNCDSRFNFYRVSMLNSFTWIRRPASWAAINYSSIHFQLLILLFGLGPSLQRSPSLQKQRDLVFKTRETLNKAV